MKKIRITTFHRAHNYGAILQAYALQKFLEENNEADVKFINYENEKIEKQYRVFKFFGRNPIKLAKQLVENILYFRKNLIRYNEFNKFSNNKLKVTKRVYKKADEIEENANVYITGSDQVWNPKIVGELSDVYTLNFAKEGTKKISYAASVGDANEIKKNEKIFKEKLSGFNEISVREEDAKTELEKIIDKQIEVVLDPTMLITKEEWQAEIKNEKKIEQKYILAYVVQEDKEFVKIVNYLSEKTGLKVIHFSNKNLGINNVLKSAYTDGPLKFLKYIKDAEYIVGTSFHATVFSIIFNKKFFVVPHRKTGARVINLIKKIGIEQKRDFSTLEEFKNIDFNLEENWKKINEKILEEREKSIKWLKNAI